MNKIIFFSGGKSSFAVAHLLKSKYPQDNIVLYFTDTRFEDADLYRFIHEVSDELELPLLIHTQGMTPLDLMMKDSFIYNSRIANCSKELKSKVAKNFLTKGKKPKYENWYNKHFLKDENFTREPTLYFGIDYTEMHRTLAIIKNWQPFKVEFPLIKDYVDYDELFARYNIEKPILYKQGFTHNNCGGRCIKGGQGHWINLLKNNYQRFSQMRDFEEYLSKTINDKKGTNNKYSFMKKKGEPYTLKELETDYLSKPEQIDLFDIGGCGCFVDENNE